jgi:hypothetical protein
LVNYYFHLLVFPQNIQSVILFGAILAARGIEPSVSAGAVLPASLICSRQMWFSLSERIYTEYLGEKHEKSKSLCYLRAILSAACQSWIPAANLRGNCVPKEA